MKVSSKRLLVVVVWTLILALNAAAQAPKVNEGGLVNGASFAVHPAPVSAGSIVSIFGKDLATGTVWASSIPLPTNLNGTQVFMNAFAAPLFFVSPLQINAELPWELSADSEVWVQVIVNGVASNMVMANLAEDAPGTFTISQDGKGPAAVLHASDSRLVTEANPAQPGEFLEIFVTGLGPVMNQPATGEAGAANPLSETLTTPTVAIDGVLAKVTFAGLAPGFVGLYQINVQVPNGMVTNPQAAVMIAAKEGVSNLSTVATIPVEGGLLMAGGETDSNGNVTLTLGSTTLPLQITDLASKEPLPGIAVAATMDPSDPSTVALAILDPTITYPVQSVLLTGVPSQSVTTNHLTQTSTARTTVPISKPSSSTSAFGQAIRTVQTPFLAAPPETPENSCFPETMHAFTLPMWNFIGAGFPTLGSLGPVTSVKMEMLTTSEAALKLADLPFSNPEGWLWEQGCSMAVDFALKAAAPELASGFSPLGMIKTLVIDQLNFVLSGAVYPLMGFDLVKITTISFGSGVSITVVTPLDPQPLTGNPFPPRPPVEVCVDPPISSVEITLIDLENGLHTYRAGTGSDGCALFPVLPGSYKVVVSGPGFEPAEASLSVTDAGGTVTVPLQPLDSVTFRSSFSGSGSGQLQNPDGTTCTVQFTVTGIFDWSTSPSIFALADLAGGEFTGTLVVDGTGTQTGGTCSGPPFTDPITFNFTSGKVNLDDTFNVSASAPEGIIDLNGRVLERSVEGTWSFSGSGLTASGTFQ